MFLVHKKGLAEGRQEPDAALRLRRLQHQPDADVRADAVPVPGARRRARVANLRGGGEYGEDWHRAGMLDKKQNVFDDFIAAAEWLIDEQVHRAASSLAIQGGSNGGLLVGAALTQRPDLFRAVVCQVPLLDMVRYHQFLIARLWIPEYGSADDAEQFKWLHAYSPYHHVKEGTAYPAVLLATGGVGQPRRPAARPQDGRATAGGAPSGGGRFLLRHGDPGTGPAKPPGRTLDSRSAMSCRLPVFRAGT